MATRQDRSRVGMTEEQEDMLRKQIAIYSFISKMLFERHSYLYPNPPAKFPEKRRWAATPEQLKILEDIYGREHQVNGSVPDKQKIIQITAQLAVYGNIKEENVSNWFQNKRSRMKRKNALTTQSESPILTTAGGSMEVEDSATAPQIPPDDIVESLLNLQQIDIDMNNLLSSC